MKEEMVNYTRYNAWANSIVSSLLQPFSTDQLTAVIESSFPSLQKTIYHIWDAETIWLLRMEGKSIDYWPSKNINGSEPIDSFVKKSNELADFIAQQNTNFHTSLCTYSTTNGTIYKQQHWQIVMHCMNHSTFHRGQIITMLRQIGFENKIPSTDMITFFRNNN